MITIAVFAQEEWEFIGPDNYPSPHPGFKKIFVVNPDTICFAGWPGFCVTFDGGDNWIARINGITGTTDLTMSNDYEFYMSGLGGIFKTTNWGEEWTRLDSSIENKEFYAIKLIDEILYVSNFSGVYKSTDKGQTWEQTTYTFFGVEVIEGDSANLFLGAKTLSYPGFIRSTDGGYSWTGHPFGVLDILPFDDQNILVSSENLNHGLYFSSDNGETFMNTNYFGNNLQIINDLAVNNKGELFLAMKDFNSNENDGVFMASDGLGGWEYIGLEGKFVTELAVDDNGVLYAGVEGEGIYYYTGPYTPVELSSMSLEVAGNSVILIWSTATETNNKGFEVQRKSEKSWDTIGYVEGHGTVTTASDYTFIDSKPISGKNVYRLKQIDFNGDYKYSEVESVTFSSIENSINQNYPNPFNPTTTISFSLSEEGNVKIEIYDSNGRLIEKLIEQNYAKGKHEISFNGEKLASGIYFYRIEALNSDSVPLLLNMGKMVLIK